MFKISLRQEKLFTTKKTVCDLSCNLLQHFTNSGETPNSLRSQAFAAQWDRPLSIVLCNNRPTHRITLLYCCVSLSPALKTEAKESKNPLHSTLPARLSPNGVEEGSHLSGLKEALNLAQKRLQEKRDDAKRGFDVLVSSHSTLHIHRLLVQVSSLAR